jgi:ubiquinone/menaquinone biosynthesis C-methylase UbiE
MGKILAHNEPVAARWSAGGRLYDEISRQIADSIEHCVDRLEPESGERILDLATGTGWTARRVSARGAQVTACDIAAGVIDAARQIPHENVAFEVADAEALPYEDGQFDGVISTCGIQFVTVPEAASQELARVTRPGGRVALTLWTSDGSVAEMFKVIKKYMPPPPDGKGPPSPFEWGKQERVQQLLGRWFKLGFEKATSFYRASAPGAAWDAFVGGYGPVKALAARLDETARESFRAEFTGFHEQFRTDLGILVPRDYWLVRGERT